MFGYAYFGKTMFDTGAQISNAVDYQVDKHRGRCYFKGGSM